jgi:anti-anti-sigma regulatory factor
MLRIQRSTNGEVLVTVSGRLNAENLGDLKTQLQADPEGRRIILDLKDLTLVDRGAVRFLERCEADSIKLKNCPAYIREWIVREREMQSDLH